jgi:myo-inositol-1(or 4)-monophosphatase
MAAGVLLVQEAGGRFTDFKGSASSVYGKQVVASNGLIHNMLVDILGRGLSPEAATSRS